MDSTEFNNWCKIELLLGRASECLREEFEQSWQRKYKEPWSNASEVRKRFTENLGSTVFEKSRIQRKNLNSGDITSWDLTMFNAIFTSTNLNKDREFQTKLKRLVLIRNEIAHLSVKRVTAQEYAHHWNALKEILLFLGATDEDLDDIIHSRSNDSKLAIMNENVPKATELKLEGNKMLKEGEFRKAVSKYTDAIILPGIPDRDLSVLYSNRSHCYLKLGDYAKAVEDAKIAKRLDPDYVKAYVRLGKAYKAQKKYDKAIKNFDIALSLDTNNEEISLIRSDVRRLKGLSERDDDQAMKDLAVKNRQLLNGLKNKDAIKKVMMELNPTLKHVWAGHDYRDNNKYEKAAECYQKAADMGNAEGMYNLALFLVNGYGVRKDYARAYKLLLEASTMDPFDKFKMPVVGVKEAEHSIALGYYEGTFVDKNTDLAIIWYEKAISHQNGMSANNLALMYMNGDGVDRDFKRAENLFLYAMNHGDPNAMDNIVTLFLASGNVSKAQKWNEKSKQQGSKLAHSLKKEIEKMAADSNEKLAHIIDWEKEHKLPFENMTMHERVMRRVSHEHPEVAETLNDFESLRIKSERVSPNSTSNKGYKYDLQVLAKRKDKFEYSNRMYMAVVSFMEAMYIFDTIAQRTTVVLDDASRLFIDRLATCYKLEHYVGSMPIDTCEKIKKHVLLLLSHSDRIIKHSKDVDELKFNQDCRLCQATLNMQSDNIIDFLTACIKKYPNNTYFLELRGCMYNFVKKHEDALRDFNRFDELSKDDVDNLYHKAATYKQLEWYKKAMEAYAKFVSVAPEDHRKLPEAYYGMGVCSILSKSQPASMQYYKQGLDAEKKQIPFFLPYESTSKDVLELMLPKEKQSLKETKVVKPTDPFKKELILNQRQCAHDFGKVINSEGYVKTSYTGKPSKSQSAPLSWVGLKPIYLNEINPADDHILEGFVLEVTLITTTYNNSMSINFVVEDANSNVQRVALYNFDREHQLVIGAQITIINPYLRIAMDGKAIIRIDDPNTVIVGPIKVIDMCHYCGKANSKLFCSKCKQARYCSKDCQVLDWKELSHKLICSL